MFTWSLDNMPKIIIGLVIAIFAGAVGSAAWENVRDPLFGYFSEVSVTITTLGKDEYVDAMYREVGMGFSQNYSISSYYSLHETVFAVFLATILIAARIFMSRKMRPGNPEDAPEGYDHLRRRLKTFLYALTVMILALLVFFQISRLSSEYKNNAILHIHQAITICSPYISEKEEKVLYSKFSSIRSREDYVKLDRRLQKIADKNNLRFPEFEVF